jgi:hypothetical protein
MLMERRLNFTIEVFELRRRRQRKPVRADF